MTSKELKKLDHCIWPDCFKYCMTLYSSLCFNFTIMKPLLSAGLGNMLQLTSTFETRILQILLLIFNDLPLGITVTFLKKILLDTSNPSSLQMPETTLVTLQHLSTCHSLTWNSFLSQCLITSRNHHTILP